MKRTQYTKESLREISFPLGGIGTGCIGLAGNGALTDWEIAGSLSRKKRLISERTCYGT